MTSLISWRAGARLGAFAALCLWAPAFAASAADEARLQENWRISITQTPAPAQGCFVASYPSLAWQKVACQAAPNRRYLPRHGAGAASLGGRTVGNGADYSAVTSTLTKSAIGSFPAVTGVRAEKDSGVPNDYSLQLNSGFMTTAGCAGSTTGQCQSWEQFVYSSGSQAAFMQYWLINYGATCPSGWYSYSADCYTNSNAVGVPPVAAKKLASLKVSATAVAGGLDTFVMTVGTKAYTTTGQDSVVYLATAWHASEFNVIGDGGGSEANFNKGANITVKITVNDGSTSAPTCKAKDGTTGETNNLTIGACVAAGGAAPSVMFTEKN